MGRARRAPRITVLVDRPADEGRLERVLSALRASAENGCAQVLVTRAGRDDAIGSARNDALAKARAEHLLFIDSESIPHPDLVPYAVDFHARHPQLEVAVAIGQEIDWTAQRNPILAWRWRTRDRADSPQEAGVYAWPQFRIGVLSCKRALLAEERFDPRFAAGSDRELAARLARRFALRVLFEGVTLATRASSVSLADALAAEYRDGYYRRVRVVADDHARVASDAADRFAFADAFVLSDEQEAHARATVEALAPTVADTTVHEEDTAARLELFEHACEMLFDHHAARGWLAAARV